MSVSINDIHSGLNAALVARVSEVSSIEDVARELVRARGEGLSAIAAGGRHAMGGQQFAEGGVVLDTRVFNRVPSFDPERGLLQVEAGIQWPELVGFLTGEQDADEPNRWKKIQKHNIGVRAIC